MESKVCFRCQQERHLSEFYRHPKMADGYLGKCKDCTRADVRENYLKRADQYRAYEKARNATAERKRALQSACNRSRANGGQKWAARQAVKRAIRSGHIVRPEACSSCGAVGRIEAHHHDYSKPLDVMWLCFKCHRIEHGQYRDLVEKVR